MKFLERLFGAGGSAKEDLIRDLAKERVRSDPMAQSMGFSADMIDSLGTMELMGIPEAAIVTIVETYALSLRSGAPESAILEHIENHRSQIGSGTLPQPLNLDSYIVGFQIMEEVMLHQRVERKEARQKTIEMLRVVEIPSPEERIDQYPHQLSGGMRQRVMIAMALVCRPSLLIADEPTTALDVTIQAQVLQLMRHLRQKFEMAMMLITHDLGVIAAMADDVMVMYLGQIVEKASVDDVFYQTKHPYTQGLMSSIPSLATKQHRLIPIEGTVPDPLALPSGCRFQPRCRRAMERCHHENPTLKEVAPRAPGCLLLILSEGGEEDDAISGSSAASKRLEKALCRAAGDV